MIIKKFTLFFALFVCTVVLSQEDNNLLDAPDGLRIDRNGEMYIIYADNSFTPNILDFRKINSTVFFRKIDYPTKMIEGIEYQLITIPGNCKNARELNEKVSKDSTIKYLRSGNTVNCQDYDANFWIKVEVIENKTNIEYNRFGNDVFSGLLTAPFKYRLKVGNAPEALLDGDFNIAPFIGWKWRTSNIRPFYIAPFIFTGVTSLNYNSGNNSKISDSEILENGAGLTYGLGLSLKFGTVSPGFIIGWDKGFGNLGSGFEYNDKVWISFSVNYDFFKPKASDKVQGN